MDGTVIPGSSKTRWGSLWSAVPPWARFAVFPFTLAVVASMVTSSFLYRGDRQATVGSDPLSVLMGISDLGARPAPGFALTDQDGRSVALSAFRGRAVLLAFVDDRCTQVCPVLAQEFRLADRDLGAGAKRVALVGVNVDAGAESSSALQAFDRLHGLDTLANWYFLTGSTPALQAAWESYGIDVTVSQGVDQTSHAAYLYFIDPAGRERYIANPQVDTRADGSGYLPPGDLDRWGAGIAAYLNRALGP